MCGRRVSESPPFAGYIIFKLLNRKVGRFLTVRKQLASLMAFGGVQNSRRSTAWAGGVRAAVCALVGGAAGPAARDAAQRALRHGWPVLLPTPAERARLLSSLLPQGSFEMRTEK